MNPSATYTPGMHEPGTVVSTRPEHGSREQHGPVLYDSASAGLETGQGHSFVYTPGSLWSHLKYGLGMLAFMLIPPLIPGVTGRGLIMGYIGLLMIIYTVVCVWGMVRSLYPARSRRRTRPSRPDPSGS